jgi:drug/metabolite transporter (DMT)-like permease
LDGAAGISDVQKAATVKSGLKPRLKVNAVTGILLVCIATVLFSGIDTTAKYLVSVVEMPVSQVVWIRFLGQFGAIILAFGLFSVPRLLKTKRIGFQIVRSGLLLASTLCNFLAIRYLRLDQAVTIQFLAPLMVALLAGPLLGEWVGWRRLVAIGVGFCGVLIAVRPGFQSFEPAFIFAFATVACYALFQLFTRFLAPYDPPEVTLFYSLLLGAVLMAPMAIADWVWPQTPLVWVLVITLGIWGAAGHGIFIMAYRHADASTLAPFIYLSLITHTSAGYFVFGHVPDAWTMAGAVVIVGSGLYILWRERVTAKETVVKASKERLS